MSPGAVSSASFRRYSDAIFATDLVCSAVMGLCCDCGVILGIRIGENELEDAKLEDLEEDDSD